MYVCLQYFMKRVFYVFLQVSLWVSKALGGFKALSLTYILEYCIFTFVRFFYLLSYPRNFESACIGSLRYIRWEVGGRLSSDHGA